MYKTNEFSVYLRGLEIDDAEMIFSIHKEPAIIKGFLSYNNFPSFSNEKKWLESKISNTKDVSTAICLKETDELIGCIFLNDINLLNRSGHCPVFISSKFQGKGYATQARILILQYAFYERGLNRIVAYVNENNISSLRVLEKCGYKIEGFMRQSRYQEGLLINQYILSILKEDFDKIVSL